MVRDYEKRQGYPCRHKDRQLVEKEIRQRIFKEGYPHNRIESNGPIRYLWPGSRVTHAEWVATVAAVKERGIIFDRFQLVGIEGMPK